MKVNIMPRLVKVGCVVIALLGLLEISLPQRSAAGATQTKHKQLTSILQRISRLDDLAMQMQRVSPNKDIGNKVREKIRIIVFEDQRVDILFVTAVILRATIGDQSIETRRYDQVFEDAFWLCVRGISEHPGLEARRALDKLAMGMDGGDKLSMDEYRMRQKSLKHSFASRR